MLLFVCRWVGFAENGRNCLFGSLAKKSDFDAVAGTKKPDGVAQRLSAFDRLSIDSDDDVADQKSGVLRRRIVRDVRNQRTRPSQMRKQRPYVPYVPAHDGIPTTQTRSLLNRGRNDCQTFMTSPSSTADPHSGQFVGPSWPVRS